MKTRDMAAAIVPPMKKAEVVKEEGAAETWDDDDCYDQFLDALTLLEEVEQLLAKMLSGRYKERPAGWEIQRMRWEVGNFLANHLVWSHEEKVEDAVIDVEARSFD